MKGLTKYLVGFNFETLYETLFLTYSLILHFETVPNSNKLQTTTEMLLLTLSQTTNLRRFQTESVCR